MLVFKQLFTFLKCAVPLNSVLCTVLIRAYRGQHWKDKQNEIPKKKNRTKQKQCQTCFIYKISKAFCYCKKWQVVCSCLTFCYKTGGKNYIPFQWHPLYGATTFSITTLSIMTLSIMGLFATLNIMRLCRPPDGSTSPNYKLLCFKPP